ncbi:Ras-related protein Rab7, partial [Zea mays]
DSPFCPPFQAGPSDPQRFLFILVGNKIDLDGGSKRMVPEKKAREWCASKGDIPYFETSAKEVHNVDTAFLCIARLALEHEHDQDIYGSTRRSFNTLDTWHDEFLNQVSHISHEHIRNTLRSLCLSRRKAGEWCASKGDIPYFETSAKEDHNVDTAFLCMARLALEHEHDQDIYFKTVAEQFPETEQTSGCAC